MPPATNRSAFSKLFLIFSAGLLLGIGLCGLDNLLASHGIGKSTEEFGVGPLDGVSLLTMCLSVLGLGFTAIAWVLFQIVRAFLSKSDDREPTRLFDKKDGDE